MKNNRRHWSIRWNIFAYFIGFLVFLLVLLWVFQVGFLDTFYKTIKKRDIEATAQQVIKNYRDETGLGSLEQYALENEFHIRVVSNQGILISESVGVPNIWIQNIIETQYRQIYQAAIENGGDIYISFRDYGTYYQNTNEYITYVAIADSSTMVVIQALIVPVNSTVSTLKVQLFIISGLLAGLALIFSWVVSRQLSKPLIQLNDEAKLLGTGLEDQPFDATGYKEVNELSQALNGAHQSLSELESMRKELLANVSHDLRTPLTVIQGYGELIRDIPGEDSQENAQIIVDESQYLSRLVDDLLDLSKLQDGIDTVDMKALDMDEVVDEVLKRYQHLVNASQKIAKDIDAQYTVMGDRVKIHQVLYNLINNSLQHGGDQVSVTIRCRSHGSNIRVEVIDDGKGMSKEDTQRVWDRYVRSDTKHTRNRVGSGLGLAIVKHVLLLHKVPFGVESIVDEGSTFWFELKKVEKD